MRKWMTGMVLAALLMVLSAAAVADSEGAIVQSSCSIVQSGNYYLVYCYAQVHNNSDQIICLDEGTFELHNGEQLLASQSVSQIWPYFVNPGEDGYLFDVVAFEPDDNGNPVVPAISNIAYDIRYMTVDPRFGSKPLQASAEIVHSEADGLQIVCRLLNMSEADAYSPTVAIGLYTDHQYMVYADGVTLQNVGVPAGGMVLVRFAVDDAFAQQWESYGATPTRAQVSASFRRDED